MGNDAPVVFYFQVHLYRTALVTTTNHVYVYLFTRDARSELQHVQFCFREVLPQEGVVLVFDITWITSMHNATTNQNTAEAMSTLPKRIVISELL